jgi:transposase
MIPEAREVRLWRGDRKVLEARCRSPRTMQRDLKRARIALLAADGLSTRAIAKEVGIQPRIVSRWRHRYADHGLDGLEDKPRPGKKPLYTQATDKRILGLLDKPPPAGFARWTGPLLAKALGDVDGVVLNTHKKNERWLKRHPTVHFHFTPTRSSWLNQVGTWFSILQGQSLSGASFTAVKQLQEHIDALIAAYNQNAKPFAWKKKRVYQRRFKGRRITKL